jgi:hypothetical protein
METNGLINCDGELRCEQCQIKQALDIDKIHVSEKERIRKTIDSFRKR